MSKYLYETENLYRGAALKPDVGLCCTTTPMLAFPGLAAPDIIDGGGYC